MRKTLANLAITAAQALAPVPGSQLLLNDGARSLTAQANFTYGSGGSSVDAYLQTSIDNGSTWTDIAKFHFTTASGRLMFNLSSLTTVAQYTPTNGTLAANTFKDGILGNLFQVQVASVGTYAGSTLSIDVVAQER